MDSQAPAAEAPPVDQSSAPAPVMDVTPPPDISPEPLATPPPDAGPAPQPAEPPKDQPTTDQPKSDKEKPAAEKPKPVKPAEPKQPGVTAAIAGTVIIVLGLAALATVAYIKTR